METLEAIRQIVEIGAGIVIAVLAVLAKTKWGQTQQAQQAEHWAYVLREAADAAVAFAEQMFRKEKTPSGMADTFLPERKKETAETHLRTVLPEGHPFSEEILSQAVEAAVGRMNALQ